MTLWPGQRSETNGTGDSRGIGAAVFCGEPPEEKQCSLGIGTRAFCDKQHVQSLARDAEEAREFRFLAVAR